MSDFVSSFRCAYVDAPRRLRPHPADGHLDFTYDDLQVGDAPDPLAGPGITVAVWQIYEIWHAGLFDGGAPTWVALAPEGIQHDEDAWAALTMFFPDEHEDIFGSDDLDRAFGPYWAAQIRRDGIPTDLRVRDVEAWGRLHSQLTKRSPALREIALLTWNADRFAARGSTVAIVAEGEGWERIARVTGYSQPGELVSALATGRGIHAGGPLERIEIALPARAAEKLDSSWGPERFADLSFDEDGEILARAERIQEDGASDFVTWEIPRERLEHMARLSRRDGDVSLSAYAGAIVARALSLPWDDGDDGE